MEYLDNFIRGNKDFFEEEEPSEGHFPEIWS
jgi:hypothetical protein